MKKQLFEILMRIANEFYDGHFTVMKFTTNWRVCFGTPEDREARNTQMSVGETFEEASLIAIEHEVCKSKND